MKAKLNPAIKAFVVITLGTLCITASASSFKEKEREIPLSEVPEQVIAAARAAVEGITLTEAEIEETRKGLIYEIEGFVGDTEYEIEITTEGDVIEVEIENDHDDDEDEDRDNDDDDDDEDERPEEEA